MNNILIIFIFVVRFVRSQRGKQLILLNNYTYTLATPNTSKSILQKKRWVCSTHVSKGCKAVVYTIQDILVSMKNEHYHNAVN